MRSHKLKWCLIRTEPISNEKYTVKNWTWRGSFFLFIFSLLLSPSPSQPLCSSSFLIRICALSIDRESTNCVISVENTWLSWKGQHKHFEREKQILYKTSVVFFKRTKWTQLLIQILFYAVCHWEFFLFGCINRGWRSILNVNEWSHCFYSLWMRLNARIHRKNILKNRNEADIVFWSHKSLVLLRLCSNSKFCYT